MADHTIYGSHGIDPTSPPLPGWVHDAADLIREASAMAATLRLRAGTAGDIADGSVAGTLQEGLDEAAEKIELAVSLANLKLDEIGCAA